jgi:hypothetical protein
MVMTGLGMRDSMGLMMVRMVDFPRILMEAWVVDILVATYPFLLWLVIGL